MTDIREEMVRWRIAYDTVSALVARLGDHSSGLTATSCEVRPDHVYHSRYSPGGLQLARDFAEHVPSDSRDDVPNAARDYVTSSSASDPRNALPEDWTSNAVSGRRAPVTRSNIRMGYGQRTHSIVDGRFVRPYMSTANIPEVNSTGSRIAVNNVAGRTDVGNNSNYNIPSSPIAHLDVNNRRPVDIPISTPDITTSLLTSGQPIHEADVMSSRRLLTVLDLPYLYDCLANNFYTETFLWLYINTLLHPGSRRTRNRLRALAVATGRTLEQAMANVLSGYLVGYRQSRLSLSGEVEFVLWEISNTVDGLTPTRAAWLGELSVELGVVLNPRQMLRSFASVVRELVWQSVVTVQPTREFTRYHIPTNPSIRTSTNPRQPTQQPSNQSQQPHDSATNHRTFTNQPNSLSNQNSQYIPRQFSTNESSRPHHLYSENILLETRDAVYTDQRWRSIPPPPPPYPGFLLHFLAVLGSPPPVEAVQSTGGQDILFETYEALLDLSDRIGDVKSRGMSVADIALLPSYLFIRDITQSKCQSIKDVQDLCVVCLSNFEKGQLLRSLPCCHDYHAKCIDKWLLINCTCPVCRHEVTGCVEHSAV